MQWRLGVRGCVDGGTYGVAHWMSPHDGGTMDERTHGELNRPDNRLTVVGHHTQCTQNHPGSQSIGANNSL
jgi:hypothetical protein